MARKKKQPEKDVKYEKPKVKPAPAELEKAAQAKASKPDQYFVIEAQGLEAPADLVKKLNAISDHWTASGNPFEYNGKLVLFVERKEK